MNLFEVSTKNYKQYYVLAKDYNQAHEKAMNEILQEGNSVVNSEGDLITNPNMEEILQIKDLGDKLIK